MLSYGNLYLVEFLNLLKTNQHFKTGFFSLYYLMNLSDIPGRKIEIKATEVFLKNF